MNQWTQTRKKDLNSDENDIYCLDKANSESKNEILKDLLWTLYSKLEAVLRGHRFVETCARRIKKVEYFLLLLGTALTISLQRLLTAKLSNEECTFWRKLESID